MSSQLLNYFEGFCAHANPCTHVRSPKPDIHHNLRSLQEWKHVMINFSIITSHVSVLIVNLHDRRCNVRRREITVPRSVHIAPGWAARIPQTPISALERMTICAHVEALRLFQPAIRHGTGERRRRRMGRSWPSEMAWSVHYGSYQGRRGAFGPKLDVPNS